MKAISDSCNTQCRILIASLRSVEHMCQLAKVKHFYFPLNPALITKLFASLLNDKAIAESEQVAKN
jgi:hypothetical protein